MDSVRKSHQVFRLLVGSVFYQVVWFATVLSAGHVQRWWWGILSLLVFVGIVHFGWPALRQRVWWMLVISVGCGLIVDTGMIMGHVWQSPRILLPTPLPPAWLLFLWAAFGIYIALSLEMLYGRYGLAAFVGAIGGMLAYRGGALFEAIQWGKPLWLTTTILTLTWGFIFPLLVWVATRLRQQEQAARVRASRMHVAFM